MTTPASPLAQISSDTETLVAQLKSSAAQLSTDAKAGLEAALLDAHKEVTDAEGAGTSIWSALLAAIGKA
jgi:hypothetical protein